MDVQHRRGRISREGGFSVIELAIVLVILGLVIGPLLTLVGTQMGASKRQRTTEALDTAEDALISFAAQHQGCLPFAADFEGGLPDTDVNGAAGHTDVGQQSPSKRAGDLPWATLGLGGDFLDGDSLRLQYYVATPWTDDSGSADPIVCPARFLGFEYNQVTYNGSPSHPIYVYYTSSGAQRELYKITEMYAPSDGAPPDAAATLSGVENVTCQLASNYLEVRTGPNVTGEAPQTNVESERNVFVLIAAGTNRNPLLNRSYVRDASHKDGDGSAWIIESDPTNVDDKLLSATTDKSGEDSGEHGDDRIRYMSFTRYKAELSKHGINMETVMLLPGSGTCP